MLFAAGYGAGKTRAGAMKAAQLALLNPGCTGLMIGPTWQMTDRLVLDAFMSACPREIVAEYHKSERRIEITNGSRIYFGSADKPGSLEGVTVAWAWVDEARLISAEAWRTIAGRVRDKRAKLLQTFATTTPAMGWLSEFFDGSPGRLTLHCSTEENRANLAEGFIEGLRRTYSARLAKSLIDGQFAVIAGQVYEEFDETKHVLDGWRYDPRLPLWLSWDFGVRAASILFAQQTGDFELEFGGRVLPPRSVVIFDELQPEQVPTAHQIPLVVKRLHERGVPMDGSRPRLERGLFRIACDPAGAGRDQATGIPSVALLEHAFGSGVVRYETDFAERHIPNRIQRVMGALEPADGSDPRLYVDRRLVDSGERRGIVKALRGSVYPEKGGRQESDVPKVDDYEHARDTLEYLWVLADNATRPTTQHRMRLVFGAGR